MFADQLVGSQACTSTAYANRSKLRATSLRSKGIFGTGSGPPSAGLPLPLSADVEDGAEARASSCRGSSSLTSPTSGLPLHLRHLA